MGIPLDAAPLAGSGITAAAIAPGWFGRGISPLEAVPLITGFGICADGAPIGMVVDGPNEDGVGIVVFEAPTPNVTTLSLEPFVMASLPFRALLGLETNAFESARGARILLN